MEKDKSSSLLTIITGPSGAGKDTVIQHIEKKNPSYRKVLTCTSRAMRPGERHGLDYFFIDKGRFEILLEQNAFFEWVEYRGEYYGTLIKDLMSSVKEAPVVIWRIDVSGAIKVREKIRKIFPKNVFIFIQTDNIQTLSERIQSRPAAQSEDLNWSLERAEWEIAQAEMFDNVIVNSDGKLDEVVSQVTQVIKTHR
jgi:guanylate kinase